VLALAWILWLAVALLVVGGILRFAREQGELIAPLPICLATIGFYVLPRSAYLLLFHRPPVSSAGLSLTTQQSLIAQTLGLACLASLAFIVGHSSWSASRHAARTRFTLPDPDFGRALWISVAAGFVGFLVMLYMLGTLGDIEYVMNHQHEVNLILQGKQAVFQLTRLTIVPVALLLVDHVRRQTRWAIWIFAALCLIAYIPFGYRVFILLAAGYPLGLYHLVVRQIPIRRMAIMGIAGGFILFSFSYWRLFGAAGLGHATGIFRQNPAAAVHFAFNASSELKIFDAATIIVRDVPNELDYSYGARFAVVPFTLIPRRIWHEKPTTLGHMIVERYQPSARTAWPPMAIGEFFAAAGAFGVALGFWLLGWIGRFGWEWFRARRNAGNASVYLMGCFFIYDFTRVGDPSRTFLFFLFAFMFLTTAFAIASPQRLRESPAPP
jgi:hypothetical protein